MKRSSMSGLLFVIWCGDLTGQALGQLDPTPPPNTPTTSPTPFIPPFNPIPFDPEKQLPCLAAGASVDQCVAKFDTGVGIKNWSSSEILCFCKECVASPEKALLPIEVKCGIPLGPGGGPGDGPAAAADSDGTAAAGISIGVVLAVVAIVSVVVVVAIVGVLGAIIAAIFIVRKRAGTDSITQEVSLKPVDYEVRRSIPLASTITADEFVRDFTENIMDGQADTTQQQQTAHVVGEASGNQLGFAQSVETMNPMA
jgi:hypothetical protein